MEAEIQEEEKEAAEADGEKVKQHKTDVKGKFKSEAFLLVCHLPCLTVCLRTPEVWFAGGHCGTF